jgi:ribosome-associated protein
LIKNSKKRNETLAQKKKNSSQTSLANAQKTISLIANLALDKKVEDLVVLDVRKIANFCDYFVICSSHSDRQVKAVADNIRHGLKEQGIMVSRPEGLNDATWAIVDVGNIIVHIFEKNARDFYGLEYLWQAGQKVDWHSFK